MKILVVHNRYRSTMPSGENEVVETEVAALRELGVDVVTYLRSSDEIPGLPVAEKATLPLRPLWSRRDVAAVEELLDRERPDVVHLHNPFPLISPAVIGVAQRVGVPVVQTVHNFRHVCASGTYFRDGHPCHECRDAGSPLPAVRHGCYRGSRPQSVLMAAALVRHRPTFRGLDRLIALTPQVAEHLVRYGADPERVVVKPNTVDDPGVPTPAGSGFLFVGRLSQEKGLDLLLDAWQRQPDGALGRLTRVGDGPQRATAVAAATRRNDVVVTGRIAPAQVQAAMRAAAVVVVPSVWTEVFPRVIVEALGNGRGVLATRVGGLPEIVADGGWVADPDPDSLAAILRQAAGSDAVAVGAAARRRYEALYSPAVVHQSLVQVYEDVVRERAGQGAAELRDASSLEA
jgi:glycosyltransferase involved in cell wall biosynthesis